MKKFLLFAFILCSVSPKAQTLVDTNKVWNVVDCYGLQCGTTNYSFGADTIIGTNHYRLLIVDDDSAFSPAPYEPLAMREDTAMKQVFFYDNSGEVLIYDFSLNQGYFYSTTFRGCNITISVDVVDSVILSNGESRKRMYVLITGQGPGAGCLSFQLPEIWIEGIGSLYGLTRVAYSMHPSSSYSSLSCFHENDTLKYFDSGFASCFYSTVGVNDLMKRRGIKIYPNPTEDLITIELESPMKINSIHVSNALDELLINTNEVRVDLSRLAKGIYFIRVMTDAGSFDAKVVR